MKNSSSDVAYVLAYSVVMLNTDAHNPQVKKKMTKADFVRNNRGINDGADLPEAFLAALYDRIVGREIRMKDDGDDVIALTARPCDVVRDSADAICVADGGAAELLDDECHGPRNYRSQPRWLDFAGPLASLPCQRRREPDSVPGASSAASRR